MKCVVIGSVHEGIYKDFRTAAIIVAPLIQDKDKKMMSTLMDNPCTMQSSRRAVFMSNDIRFYMMEEK